MPISIDAPDKRLYYELESANNYWTARELERQIHSLLYERLLLSNGTAVGMALPEDNKTILESEYKL